MFFIFCEYNVFFVKGFISQLHKVLWYMYYVEFFVCCSLRDVTLDAVSALSNSSVTLRAVEKCSCPRGYQGLSCEVREHFCQKILLLVFWIFLKVIFYIFKHLLEIWIICWAWYRHILSLCLDDGSQIKELEKFWLGIDIWMLFHLQPTDVWAWVS